MNSLLRNTPEVAVAVVGLSSCEAVVSEGNDLVSDHGSGVGKTALCRRFALPSHDDYAACEQNDSYSVVSAEEFRSNRVINSVHYLYYGRTVRTCADVDQPVIFHVVEHTTIAGPDRYPHGGNPLPYAERAMSSLRCPAKLACLASRSHGQPFRFPCEAFSSGPDGYVFVLDCSAVDEILEQQLDLAEDMADRLSSPEGQARPMAIAFSKCDLVDKTKLTEVRNRRALFSTVPCFELSSKTGVGVDFPFFHVFTASRRRGGFGEGVTFRPYSVLTRIHSGAVGLAWAELETLLTDLVSDLSTTWSEVVEKAGRNPTLAALLCLCGRQAVLQRFRQHLVRLKLMEMERKIEDFKKDFRETLQTHPNLNALVTNCSDLENYVFANFTLPCASSFAWPLHGDSAKKGHNVSDHFSKDEFDCDFDNKVRRCYNSAVDAVLGLSWRSAVGGSQLVDEEDDHDDDGAYFCPPVLCPDLTRCKTLQKRLVDNLDSVNDRREDILPGVYIDLIAISADGPSCEESDSSDEVEEDENCSPPPSPPDVPTDVPKHDHERALMRSRSYTEPVMSTHDETSVHKEHVHDMSPLKKRLFNMWREKQGKKEPMRKEMALERSAKKMRARMEKEREKQRKKEEKERQKKVKGKTQEVSDTRKNIKRTGQSPRLSAPEMLLNTHKSMPSSSTASPVTQNMDVTVEMASNCSEDEKSRSSSSAADLTSPSTANMCTGEVFHVSLSLPCSEGDHLSVVSDSVLFDIKQPLPDKPDDVHSSH